MKNLIKGLLKKTNHIERSIYCWNFLNAALSAMQSTLILVVLTRTNNMDDVGTFSIAYAVASLMLFIGQYGLRKYQVSDIREQFSFANYLSMRIITCLVMVAVSTGYCVYVYLFNDYSVKKACVVFLVCILKTIQAFADVLHGQIQKMGRLDVAAKASFWRILVSIIACMIGLVLTGNLVISMIICVASAIITFFLTSVNVAADYGRLSVDFNYVKIKALTIEGFPLFLSTFLSMYIANAPKYAIDAFLTDEIQAYYNFIFMPAFAVQLLANFIFNPIIDRYARIWTGREYKKFWQSIKKSMLQLAAITAVGLICAYAIGVPVLSWLFNTSLLQYKVELCVVMLGGGMLAYVSFFVIILTIMRHQNIILLGYIVVAAIARIMSGFFVLNYGIFGAALMYTALMTALAVILFIAVVVFFNDASRCKTSDSRTGDIR